MSKPPPGPWKPRIEATVRRTFSSPTEMPSRAASFSSAAWVINWLRTCASSPTAWAIWRVTGWPICCSKARISPCRARE